MPCRLVKVELGKSDFMRLILSWSTGLFAEADHEDGDWCRRNDDGICSVI
jgi:hypothetical protein